MNTLLLITNIVLWPVVLIVGFLLLGTLRSLGILSWRLEQLEMTTPSRIGRSGLKVGKKAPDFTLSVAHADCVHSQTARANGELALHDFAGCKVLLVFTQSGCPPCKAIVPELNRVHEQGEHQVLVINNGDMEASRQWVAETGARFPVLVQEKFSQSKRYEVFATPFAFLIDETGMIASKGIAGTAQHLGYVITGVGNRVTHDLSESERTQSRRVSADTNDSEVSLSSKEIAHV